MNLLKKSGFAVLMSLFAFSVTVSNVAKAETNPFADQTLITFAANDAAEAKCGESKDKCGESKAKCGESKAKCGESKAKAKCGEGKCGESKAKAKCGESKAKCGESKAKKCGE